MRLCAIDKFIMKINRRVKKIELRTNADKIIHTLRLPRVQYSVRMQIFGGSVQAPMNAQMLSWRKSRIYDKDAKVKSKSLGINAKHDNKTRPHWDN